MCVLVAESCPTLCDSMDYSPSGYSAMGFLRQEYSSGFPFPSPGDLPDPGIKARSPALQVDSLLSEPVGESCIGKALCFSLQCLFIPSCASFLFPLFPSLLPTQYTFTENLYSRHHSRLWGRSTDLIRPRSLASWSLHSSKEH